MAALTDGMVVLLNGLGGVFSLVHPVVIVMSVLGLAGAGAIAASEAEVLRKQARRVEVQRH